MKTALCHLLGIEHPVIAAPPMGPDLTGPDMVAAVSNAGGLGIVSFHIGTPCSGPERGPFSDPQSNQEDGVGMNIDSDE